MIGYLIYKENHDTSGMTMLEFRDSLVRSLLLGVPYENTKPGHRERSTSQTKRMLVHWLLCEGKDTTVKRSEQCMSKESENFLFWL